MKHALRYTTLVLVCLIIFSSTLISLTPLSDALPEPPDDSKLWQRIWAKILALRWTNVGSGRGPRHIFVEPSYVEIDYFGNVTVDVIWGNPTNKTYHRFQKNVLDELTLNFSIEFPPDVNMPRESIHAVFDPPTIDVRAYDDHWQKMITASNSHYDFFLLWNSPNLKNTFVNFSPKILFS